MRDIAEIYTAERGVVLRIAQRFVPRADAEDVVQAAAETMVRRRRWLRFASGEYLRKAVEYGAMRLAVRARHIVFVDERALDWLQAARRDRAWDPVE